MLARMWKIVAAVVILLSLLCAGVAAAGGWYWYTSQQGARTAVRIEQETAAINAEKQAEEDRTSQAMERGQERYLAEDWDGALDAFDAVLDAHPDDINARLGRGRAFAHLGRDERATEDLEAVLKVEPNNLQALDTLAWVYSHGGDDRAALRVLDHLIDVAPENAKAWRDRANVRFHKGEREEAIKDARQSCTLGLQEGCEMERRIKEAMR